MRNEPFIKIIGKKALPARYHPQNRTLTGIPTVACTHGRVWAAWMSGGVKEPDPQNHIVLAYSDDGGRTFTDPFLVADCEGEELRGRDPVLWQCPDGRLFLFYGFEKTYALVIGDPASPDAPAVGEPYPVFERGMLLNKPIALPSGEWLCLVDPFEREKGYRRYTCMASDDRGKTWRLKGELFSDSPDKLFWEGTLVLLPDGRLWALTRIEKGTNGGLEEHFSEDGGRTWTGRYGLEPPFRGPGTKAVLRTLRSGALLFVNNDDPSVRKNMTAYLSRDGKHWSGLLLDARTGCAYPDADEDEQGRIFCIFDSGRGTRNEIRLCRFTEESVLAGSFLAGDLAMNAVTKSGAFSDIVSAKKVQGGLLLRDEHGGLTLCGRTDEESLGRMGLTDPHGVLAEGGIK